MATWLGECAASLGGVLLEFPEGCNLPLREWINAALKFLVGNFGTAFDSVSDVMLLVLRQLEQALIAVPWWLVAAAICLIAWRAASSTVLAVGLGAALIFIGMMGLWEETMRTLAVLFIAVALSVAIGIPLGILMATTRWVRSVVNPILDAMQTVPSFCYLIPFIFFFGLGNVAATFAIFMFAVPPVVRLTNLGIRLVDRSVVEAADAFGATRRQVLWGVRVPLAMPNIMAGVNQTIMLALSMVVISSMIGARGLGRQVLRGLQNADVGMGLEAGLAILVLAIIFDRITKAFGLRLDPNQTVAAKPKGDDSGDRAGGDAGGSGDAGGGAAGGGGGGE